MELTKFHLLALLLLSEQMSRPVNDCFLLQADQLADHGYIETNGDITEKGLEVIHYAVKKAGEV